MENGEILRNKTGRPSNDHDMEEVYTETNKFLKVRVEDLMFVYKTVLDLNNGIINCRHQEKKEHFLSSFKGCIDFDNVYLFGHS
jgi:hypothetical protein